MKRSRNLRYISYIVFFVAYFYVSAKLPSAVASQDVLAKGPDICALVELQKARIPAHVASIGDYQTLGNLSLGCAYAKEFVARSSTVKGLCELFVSAGDAFAVAASLTSMAKVPYRPGYLEGLKTSERQRVDAIDGNRPLSDLYAAYQGYTEAMLSCEPGTIPSALAERKSTETLTEIVNREKL